MQFRKIIPKAVRRKERGEAEASKWRDYHKEPKEPVKERLKQGTVSDGAKKFVCDLRIGDNGKHFRRLGKGYLLKQVLTRFILIKYS